MYLFLVLFVAPLVYAGQKLFGPGVGIRLDRSQSLETLSKFCPSMTRDHDKKKVDKFASLLSSSNVHLGLCSLRYLI